MVKYFCSSDIHSHFYAWMEALTNSGFDIMNPDHKVIVCGDLFDRGDETVDCYNFAKELIDQNRLIYIRGNHEDLMCDLLLDKKKHGYHHVTNGTVKSVAAFANCSEPDVYLGIVNIDKVAKELTDFINNNTVNFFQLGGTVFVHGWVPTTCDEDKTMIVHENWRDGDWREARWENGMEMFYFEIVPQDVNTIVCGHWHTSWGWNKLEKSCSEWGPDARFDTLIHYKKNIDTQIIALDACTAYSKFVNVVVFDENGKLI